MANYPSTMMTGIRGATPQQARETSGLINNVIVPIGWQIFQTYWGGQRNPSDDIRTAREAYARLPEEARDVMELGAAQSAGQFAGSSVINTIFQAGAGAIIGKTAIRLLGPTHGPLAKRGAGVVLTGALSYLAFVGTTVNYHNKVKPLRQKYKVVDWLVTQSCKPNPDWKDPPPPPPGVGGGGGFGITA